MSRPLVAVTGRALVLGRVPGWLEPAVALPRYYTDALHRAGAVGVLAAPQDDRRDAAEALVGRVDGLLLSGGVDLDPTGYAQEPHAETKGWEPGTDAWEVALLRAALGRDMPVLAICRGHQLLNVALGGTLDQHLPDHLPERSHGVPNGGGGTRNEIHLEPGSRAAVAFASTTVVGNCHHHQGVDQVAEDLRVTGRTADGVVEVLEHRSARWVLGVQWHPEDSAMDDPVQQRLFDAFVARLQDDT